MQNSLKKIRKVFNNIQIIYLYYLRRKRACTDLTGQELRLTGHWENWPVILTVATWNVILSRDMR